MEENWRREKPFNENKLMLQQAGFGLIVFLLYTQYFKFAAYVSDRFFFANYPMSLLVPLFGIPLCYFATKLLIRLTKSTNQR